MLCVALTGTIASGKSTVANAFARYSVPIISADTIARQITAPGAQCYQPILEYFGTKAVNAATGELDRRFVRSRIFSDPTQKKWLESLMHPHIRSIIQQQISDIKSAYCIVEIPLLHNRNNYPFIQRVLLVIAKKSIQIKRIQARDGSSSEEAEAIINAQPSIAERKRIADDIIENNGSIERLKAKVADLHQKYLLLSDS